ncbi:MAG: hypothetical protein R3C56_23645 [Pirellulaceae bacterium]
MWSFFTEAPVRLPPVGWQNRIYFCSDDGFLYCVNAEDGTLEWKFSGAPNSQHVIGNQRLTSAWPARGGPVVRDGQVYFAASIWPFMGTFIYASTPSRERSSGSTIVRAHYIKQPHSAPSFAGVAPQGALVATENELIVPGGRSVPAVFDRATGSLRYFELNAGGKGSGASFVAAADDFFYVHTREKGTRAFNITTGLKTAFMPNEPVLAAGTIYSAELVEERPVIRAYGTDEQLKWEIEADGTGDLILAGNKLIAAGVVTSPRFVCRRTTSQPRSCFNSLAERIERLLVASVKLFAVTLDGKLLAFGDSTAADENSKSEPSELANRDPQTGWDISAADQRAVKEMLGSSPAEGFAFWFGSTDSGVARCLATQSPFEQLAMVDSDASRVERMRREMDAARIEGVTQHLSAAAAFSRAAVCREYAVYCSRVGGEY